MLAWSKKPNEVVHDKARFSQGKKNFPLKLGKWVNKRVLNLMKNWVVNFYWICSSKKLHYLLYSCMDHIFWKIYFSEIWAKMFSANQIAGFSNQPYLQSKSVKKPDFLHVDTNSYKFKVNQKWVWPVWSQDP